MTTQTLPAPINDSSIIPIQLPKVKFAAPSLVQTVRSNDVVATISIGKVVVKLSNRVSSDFILNIMKAMQHVR